MNVIFKDTNISPAHFRNAPPHSLLVRTTFNTIQGEGPLAGQPCVFIRLGGCNLGVKDLCPWCDSDFLVSKSKYMTFAEIQEEAYDLIRGNKTSRDGNLFIITGGEPMLQPQLKDFCYWTDWRCQIETNGMFFQSLPSKTFVVVSPKAHPINGYPKPKQEVLDIATCLKFVLTDDPSSPYHTVPDYAHSFAGPVLVSPMAIYKRAMSAEEGERASAWDQTLIDQEATARSYRYASEYAVKHGLRASIQTHLFLAMP